MKFAYNDAEYALVDPDTWTTLEAAQVQQLSGTKPIVLIMDLRDFGAMGLHAAVWISLRRAGVDVAWDAFELPYGQLLTSLNGSPVQEPPDPSTASTPPSKAKRPGGRAASARSRKN